MERRSRRPDARSMICGDAESPGKEGLSHPHESVGAMNSNRPYWEDEPPPDPEELPPDPGGDWPDGNLRVAAPAGTTTPARNGSRRPAVAEQPRSVASARAV